jgi:hypothetical protein
VEVGAAAFKDEEFSGVFRAGVRGDPSATRRAARAWSFVNGEDAFIYSVAAYGPQPGTAVVEQARTANTSCADWTTPDQLKMIGVESRRQYSPVVLVMDENLLSARRAVTPMLISG